MKFRVKSLSNISMAEPKRRYLVPGYSNISDQSHLKLLTRLHSSRMRTSRLLPVSPSMHCMGGVSAPGGYLPLVGEGVSAPGEIPASGPGGSAPRREGVPASGPGGVCSRGEGVPASGPGGCLLLGDTCLWSWGGLLPGEGVPASGPGGGVPASGPRCIPACNGADPSPVDRMTDTCKNITFANFVCGR